MSPWFRQRSLAFGYAVALTTALTMLLPGCVTPGVMSSWMTGEFRTTTYYAPDLSPDGDKVAYLKRQARFRVGSKPFLVGARPKEFSEDRLLLCRATRKLSEERCTKEWALPLKKEVPAEPGVVQAWLAWNGETIEYRICLDRFGPSSMRKTDCGGLGGKKTIVITNVPARQYLRPSAPAKWKVHLDHDPFRYGDLINNQIVVEQVE